MASAVPALSCPIRFLCIHRYAPGVRKGGKPVKKMRLSAAHLR